MNRIKQLRKKEKLTISQLSNALNIPKTTLNNYENGNRSPRDPEIWEKIADYFDVSVSYLMGLSDLPGIIEFGKAEPIEINQNGKKSWAVQQEIYIDGLEVLNELRSSQPGSLPIYLTDILDGADIYLDDDQSKPTDEDVRLLIAFVSELINKYRSNPYQPKSKSAKTSVDIGTIKYPKNK
ncbi:helix-turn-helix domain-containing protein [Enterococcus sp.]|uniref:helix-turn-helix domain-containing protein n=1 Tax=Enterococcus sp. TaxID=35783 RepID=UPI002FC903ED